MPASARPARDGDEVERALDLRRRVFCDEQGVAVDEELDGLDADAVHLVTVADDDAVVGTCRLLAEGDGTLRLGRMAVAPEARGGGAATAMLDAAHAWAREHGFARMTLHAQLTVRPLYAGAGYEEHGPVFLDAGIEHVAMDRALA